MKRAWLRASIATAAIAAALVPIATRAQQPNTAYTLLTTRERAEHLLAAWNGDAPYVPGELLVKFKAGVPTGARVSALSALRGSRDSADVRVVGDAYVVQTPGEPDAVSAAEVLQRQPEVEWAQPNYVRRLKATPNDPSYNRQWNFDLLGLPKAWDINSGASTDVTVAVVDSGITTVTSTFGFRIWTGSRFETVSVPFRVNPDISASRILPGRDFAFWNGPVLDLNGHGTHVAGTVLQETNNSLGLAGVAYKATLLPLKACLGYWDIQIIVGALDIPGFVNPELDGICDDAAVAQAIRYAADNGAQVINVSLGGADPSPIYLDALRYAVQRGSFVAIAAGNEFEDGNPVEYPAAYAAQVDGAAAVGAVGRSSRRAAYSSTGAHLELMAPGGDVRDGGAAGVIYQVGLFGPDFDARSVIRPRFDRYAEQGSQGTSMAAPHVAGVAALLFSQGITRPAAMEAAMKAQATDLGTAGRDNEYGHGLINPRAALRGMGLVK